jgi:uncharacterized phage protein gp47/JayE
MIHNPQRRSAPGLNLFFRQAIPNAEGNAGVRFSHQLARAGKVRASRHRDRPSWGQSEAGQLNSIARGRNNGQDIHIPAGVQISTADPNGPVFVTNAINLPAQSSTQSFSARALFGGSVGNAPAGVFSKHSFTGYADSTFGSLLVTNNYGIVGGRDREEDESFRYRIHLKLISPSGINEAALRSRILELPGIQDVVFKSFAGGFYAYLYAISPVMAPSLLALANDRLAQFVAFPITGQALAPDLIGISLATTVALKPSVTNTEADLVASAARAAAENYINNLGVGEPLILNQIADRILNVRNLIVCSVTVIMTRCRRIHRCFQMRRGCLFRKRIPRLFNDLHKTLALL